MTTYEELARELALTRRRIKVLQQARETIVDAFTVGNNPLPLDASKAQYHIECAVRKLRERQNEIMSSLDSLWEIEQP